MDGNPFPILAHVGKRGFLIIAIFCFRGAVAGSNTQEASDRLAVLRGEIETLDEYEKKIDQHKQVRIEILEEFFFYMH